MKLTTKGRYAVTAMLDLALSHQQGPIILADIAERQGISLSYLEQLFYRLRRRGLVKSTRGPYGGYELNRYPTQITIGEIVSAVDEAVDATRCGRQANCHNGRTCLTHTLWAELSQQIHDFLNRITLADMISKAPGLNTPLNPSEVMVPSGRKKQSNVGVKSPSRTASNALPTAVFPKKQKKHW